uniref:Protein kinase domain-containing protein n=1 Tax=Globodera pallida TaxID=36090 RepID=A0A183BJA5_GLOPA
MPHLQTTHGGQSHEAKARDVRRKPYDYKKQLGSGAFGDVYLARGFSGEVALKTELVTGNSRGYLTPGTAIGVSIQLLTAIKGLHKIGYVHREMKLDNAAIGRIKEEEQLVYLLDFGMAHRFLTKGHHQKERSKVAFQWTLQYAPHPRTWNGHTERQFQNCRGKGSSREVEVPETVRNEAFENLLEGCPKEFASPQTHRKSSAFVFLVDHSACFLQDGLQFYDEPDYTLIISILRNHLILSAINEHPFDWEIPPAELRSQRGVPLTKIKRRRRSLQTAELNSLMSIEAK